MVMQQFYSNGCVGTDAYTSVICILKNELTTTFFGITTNSSLFACTLRIPSSLISRPYR